MRVAIVLFNRVDLLDVGGPYEVLLTASRLVQRDGGIPPFEVVTVGAGPVESFGGLRLVPHTTFAEAGSFDLVIIPGAVDIDGVRADTELMTALRPLTAEAATVASVCTGAFVLHDLQLRPDTWTTHWEDVNNVGEGEAAGDASVRWVDAGEVVTSGGLSSGIAMTLHLVERFAGTDLAQRTADQLDYVWDRSGQRPPPT